MKIGFDAKWFFSGNPSGRVIVRSLLEHLLTANNEHEFYIFLKKEDRVKPFPYENPHVHPVYVWGKINLLSNFFVIPIKAFPLKLDLFIFQYFAPRFCNFNKITIINDIIFKSHPEYFSLKERLYFSPMKWLARNSRRICTISYSEKERLVHYKFAKENSIDVIYLGVGKEFRPRDQQPAGLLDEVMARYGLPEKFLLYVGRLNERKNLSNLVKAASLLTNKSVKLVLAGSSERETTDLVALITGLGMADRVIFTGFVEDKYLAPLYALAEIFCYISFDEGFGLPPLEAMASAVPLVTTAAGSLPEICGPAGNYTDPARPEKIAETIESLLNNRTLYEKKRAAGLSRSKMFTWEKSAKKLLDVCRKSRGPISEADE